MILGAIIGVVAGLAVGIIFLIANRFTVGVIFLIANRLKLFPARKCPRCGEELPQIRKPANRRQLLWGGWTCPKCGCEADARGREVRQ
jgi:hypothetical protein